MIVTIILPCRNEKDNLAHIIKQLEETPIKQNIIIVEGHSIDGTYEEALRIQQTKTNMSIAVLKQPGKGKADAVYHGCDKATGDIIIILDADLTVPPKATLDCFNLLKNNPNSFINGSRFEKPLTTNIMPPINQLGNRLASLFFSWFTNTHFKDTLCGLKAFYRCDYLQFEKIFPLWRCYDRFSDFDMLFAAHLLKLKFIQLPITYSARSYGKSQIHRVKDTLPLLKLCLIMGAKKIFNKC